MFYAEIFDRNLIEKRIIFLKIYWTNQRESDIIYHRHFEIYCLGYSAVGSASASHAEGQGFESLSPPRRMDYAPFKIPPNGWGFFIPLCHSSSPQKVTLRLCCSLASALTTLRLAANFLRVRLRRIVSLFPVDK